MKALKEGQDELVVAFRAMENDIQRAAEQAGKCIKCVFNKGWKVVSHLELPDWLKDNEFLSHGHRPQLPSFKQCFGSMFRYVSKKRKCANFMAIQSIKF